MSGLQKWNDINARSRQDTEAEFARRTIEHRAIVARIKAQHRHRTGQKLEEKLEDLPLPLDLLAIGDSWFDYPVGDAGFPDTNQDIVAQLKSLGNPQPTILSRAVLGQAMTTVMGLKNQTQYAADIADASSWLRGKPDAILVSGGGDDMVGDQFLIYLDYFGGKLSTRVQGVIDSIESSYQALFQFRNLHAPGVTIFGHCYDYAIPNGKGVLGQGPWLKPSLDFAGYNYTDGLSIVQNAIDDLFNMLNKLSADSTNNFVLIDTRNTLVRNATQPLGWANEIHPYTEGFSALANKFLQAIRAKIGGI